MHSGGAAFTVSEKSSNNHMYKCTSLNYCSYMYNVLALMQWFALYGLQLKNILLHFKKKFSSLSEQAYACLTWMRVFLVTWFEYSLRNPFMPNGISDRYQLDQCISVLRVVGW